jgi:hypothetical protein
MKADPVQSQSLAEAPHCISFGIPVPELKHGVKDNLRFYPC